MATQYTPNASGHRAQATRSSSVVPPAAKLVRPPKLDSLSWMAMVVFVGYLAAGLFA